MIAEWYLIATLGFVNINGAVNVPMLSMEACVAAAKNAAKADGVHVRNRLCINTKTGEVVKP